MKTIFFARHAKSNWGEEGVSDFDRPINSRGERDAPAMASYLEQCGYAVNQIISSDAARAMTTAIEYKKYLTPDNDVLSEHALYLASCSDITDIIENVSSEHSIVMMVGHNPGMAEAVNYYTDGSLYDMPTCSVAIVQFKVESWKSITIGSGDLLTFEYPEKSI